MKILSFFKRSISFLLTFILCSLIITFTITTRQHTESLTMEKLILAKSARVSNVITRLTYFRAREISSLILQNNGSANNFERLASSIVEDPTILYVLIAPSGIVTNIYPMQGNESLMHTNIMKEYLEIAQNVTANEEGRLILDGPVDMVGGRQVLTAHLPIYMDTPYRTKNFWGLVSVALKYPEVMDIVGLDELQLEGFGYEIYKVDPRSNEKQVLARHNYEHSKKKQCIEEKHIILNDEWYFRVFSTYTWYNDFYIWVLILISICLSFLVARLQVMTSKAKDASKAKSDFLASMSHEIRTPMNAIIGMSELLIQEKLDERQQEYVNDIKISSTALLGIINDILDVSKIEAGKLTLIPVHFNLQGFIENVSMIISFSAENKKLEFISEIIDPIPSFVYGDDVRLRQILVNLLGNAIKFTRTGLVKLSVSYLDGVAHFIISDTGIGIKESDIGRLYDSFEQFDSKKNRGIQGTGLGLSITRSLVNMMNGNIQVHSIYGKGTTFTIDIPLPAGDEGLSEDNTSIFEFISTKGANVLLVDDNEINRKVSSGLLKLNDIHCDIAINGIEAIQKVQEKDYDIVLMDHMMPEMDGVEATVKIREMGGKYKQGSLVIIALTANVFPEAKEMFIASGMDDLLSKPIDKALLNKMLIKWLPKEKQIKNVQELLLKEIPESDYPPTLRSACAIDGLNVALGLNHVSSMDDYERSLRLLSGSIAHIISELERFLENGELDRFAIDVHGMKGALAINGHTELSEMAQKLETESKNGNFEFCEHYYPDFSAKLKLLGDAIDKIFLSQEIKPKSEGSRDILIGAFTNIEDYMEHYDRESALKELKGISDYSFGSDIDKKLEELTDYLENFDFDLAVELIQNIDI